MQAEMHVCNVDYHPDMRTGGADSDRFPALVAVLIMVVVTMMSPPPALAAPADASVTTPAPALSLAALGANSTLSFYGAQGVESLTLPVPPGLVFPRS